MKRFFCRRRSRSPSPPDEQLEDERVSCQEEETVRRKQEEELLQAIQEKNPVKIKNLIEHGLDVKEVKDGRGKKSVLHCLAEVTCEGHEETKVKEIFQMFIDKECSINALDKYGNTPVKLAAEKGIITVLKLLVENKADVEIQDKLSCDTPLHWAAKQGMLEAVHILITSGCAKVNIQNKYHKTPLHLAVEENKKSVVLLLLYHKAERDIKDQQNISPLRYAETNNLPEIEALLKEPSEKFENKKQLLEYAENYDYPDIVKLFTKAAKAAQPDDHGGHVESDSGACGSNTVYNTFNYNVTMGGNSNAAIGPNAKFIQGSKEAEETQSSTASTCSMPLPSAPQEPSDTDFTC